LTWKVINSGPALAEPSSGTLAPDARTEIALTFTSIDLDSGDYTGRLAIESNDPEHELVEIPIT